MKTKTHTIKTKTILAALATVLAIPIIASGVVKADRALDVCNEVVPASNATTAADNAACISAARAAELQCSSNHGTGNQAWNNCIESYYSELSGEESGSTSSGVDNSASVVGVDPTPVDTDCDADVLDRDNCQIINWLVIGINFLSALAGIVIVASIMISGFQYMTAQDNAGQIEKARARIIQTLLALALLIFMYALLNFLIPGGVL